jgi:SHS2 domain-containing protein
MPKGFRYLEYMGDEYVEAVGDSLEEAFSNAALGMINVMLHVDRVKAKEWQEVEVEGFDLQNLLYNWLEYLLIKVTLDEFVPVKFKIEIEGGKGAWHLRGRMAGEPYDRQKHGYKSEVKAVTYHTMAIERKGKAYKLRYLLDL